ncbi:UNVERIFIED_ORG: site-specific DNA recombinase [Bacillus proteolyticus]
MHQVVGYVRVSTQEQVNGFSIQAQKEKIVEYCFQKGVEPQKVYVDAGVSGKSVKNRTALQQLLLQVKKGNIKEVVVWKVNRLARKLVDILYIVEAFQKYGVAFTSLSENFNSGTPQGLFTLQMLGAVSQLERETILENSRMGRRQRDKQGEYCGARILGYDVIPKSTCLKEGKRSNLEINNEEAKVVQKIFHWYANGLGYKEIVKQLNKRKIKTKYGKAFSLGGIYKILRNVVYIGKVRFQQNGQEYVIDGKHPAIIPEELWNRVQSKLLTKGEQLKNRNKKRNNYPLTALLKCPICNGHMVGTGKILRDKQGKSKRYRYYVCSQRVNKGSTVCNAKYMAASNIEEQVYMTIGVLLRAPSIIEGVYKKIGKSEKSSGERRIKLNAITERQSDLQVKKHQLFLDFEEEKILTDVFKQKLLKLNQELEILNEEKDTIMKLNYSKDYKISSQKYIEEIFNNLYKLLLELKDEEKKDLLSSFVREIKVDNTLQLSQIKTEFRLGENSENESVIIDFSKEDIGREVVWKTVQG